MATRARCHRRARKVSFSSCLARPRPRRRPDRPRPEHRRRRYLSQQIEKFGSVAKGLAANNAGPGAVASAQRKADAAGKPDEWLSICPPRRATTCRRSSSAPESGRRFRSIRGRPGARNQDPGTRLRHAGQIAVPITSRELRGPGCTGGQQLGRERACSQGCTKTAAATGAQIEGSDHHQRLPVRGYSPEAAVVKMALIKPYQDTAPFVRELANMPGAT